jgi:ABC-type phosphate transport system auxiliary subunit
MQRLIMVVGLLLVLGGIFVLAYKGLTYTTQENVAQIGTLKITADTEKTIFVSPVVGGAALAAGIVLLVLGRRF